MNLFILIDIFKGMITRVEKDLDDNHDNLSTTEIYSKEADLLGLNKTMGELYKKINVIDKDKAEEFKNK